MKFRWRAIEKGCPCECADVKEIETGGERKEEIERKRNDDVDGLNIFFGLQNIVVYASLYTRRELCYNNNMKIYSVVTIGHLFEMRMVCVQFIEYNTFWDMGFTTKIKEEKN